MSTKTPKKESVSKSEKEMVTLALHVKTLSETQRRRQIIKENPKMQFAYKG